MRKLRSVPEVTVSVRQAVGLSPSVFTINRPFTQELIPEIWKSSLMPPLPCHLPGNYHCILNTPSNCVGTYRLLYALLSSLAVNSHSF